MWATGEPAGTRSTSGIADAGRRRSSWSLIPEAQRLEVGLPIGEEGFTVRSFETNEYLVFAYHHARVEWVLKEGLWPKFGDCSLAFVLQPANERRTRLVVRTRVTLGGAGILKGSETIVSIP
jgi:hypothetical protein